MFVDRNGIIPMDAQSLEKLEAEGLQVLKGSITSYGGCYCNGVTHFVQSDNPEILEARPSALMAPGSWGKSVDTAELTIRTHHGFEHPLNHVYKVKVTIVTSKICQ